MFLGDMGYYLSHPPAPSLSEKRRVKGSVSLTR
jgi:hypothetical protein